MYCHKSVLNREVPFIQSVLYQRFYCSIVAITLLRTTVLQDPSVATAEEQVV